MEGVTARKLVLASIVSTIWNPLGSLGLASAFWAAAHTEWAGDVFVFFCELSLFPWGLILCR